MRPSRNTSFTVPTYILAANHDISTTHLIPSEIFNSAKGETHI